MLEATGLVKRYGGLVAIDHVDITLAPGSITGVIGPNGAGKSTLIGLIGGALTPSQGSIRLDGRDVSRMSASDRARAGIGRTYQIPRPFLDMTVEENLEVAQYSVAPLIRGEVARSERDDSARADRPLRRRASARACAPAAAPQTARGGARAGAETEGGAARRSRRRTGR